MRKLPIARLAALALVILLAGCSASSLEPLLSAPNPQAFDERLKLHGPLDSSEVPTLQREAHSQDPLRARNAAALLTLSREGQAQQSLKQLGADTADLQIWTTATASALLRQQLGHGDVPKSLERPEMIRLGLQSSEARTYKTAFTMARRLKMPELQKEIPKALKSPDSEIQALAVAALSPAQAKERLSELQSRLKDADYATFPQMAIALIETGDKTAWEAVVQSYLEHDGSSQTSFINEVNFNLSPTLHAFMVDRCDRQDAFAEEAYFVLVSQVTRETYPCDRHLMELTLPRLQRAVKTKKRDEEAEILITLVSHGSNPSKMRPDWKDLIHGQPALDLAERWLREHPSARRK